MIETLEKTETKTSTSEVNEKADKGRKALEQFMHYTQSQVDSIVEAMALAGLEAHMPLAKLAVEETQRGVYEDKIIKNIFATEYIYNDIKGLKTVGVISENSSDAVVEIAEPLGVIAGVTPVTNPTSTTMFKALIAIKTRNPIIFAFHPSAQRCSLESAKVLYEAAVKAGAPEHCIQWIEKPSIEATQDLMNHPDVSLVLATGGSGMVKSAYSTGKPALGVGPGNVPCFIERSADIKRAVTDLLLSKTFDNGMICASEQTVIVEKSIAYEVRKELTYHQAYFLNKEEIEKVSGLVINPKACALNGDIVGKSAYDIAKLSGVDVPTETKVLIAELQGVGNDYPLSREKLSPVLAYYEVDDAEEGITRAIEVTEFGGMGHTSAIHSKNKEIIKEFGERLQTSRLIVNAPTTHGAIGDIYNYLRPSLTLGCGSYGRNSTTQNVSVTNLLNIKRMANRRNNMQWFKVPSKTFFEKNATDYLTQMKGLNRVFIVTDRDMMKFGYVENVVSRLRQREKPVIMEIFSDVEPDPSYETVKKGTEAMNKFQPDCIIALGGGSPMDAAKAMWLFYEKPDVSFEGIKQKFLDIRKRVYKYPELGEKAKFVAIPTTSGTGSEVTPFSVITDYSSATKYPLADYALTPDVAIVDPVYVMTMPQTITADTGMDVLTHAIEAYVSVMANDYSDALAIKAIQLVFEYLPIAYKDGSNEVAREKMHNASTIAGMAFANAFLGINHSLAHKFGAEFHVAHGRTNAILMPHVIYFNAQKPTKFSIFPKYESFIADKKYVEIAKAIGIEFKTTEEAVVKLVKKIQKLNRKLGIESSFKEVGVDETHFEKKVSDLAEKAFEDQCTPANPKMPLITELEKIYKNSFYGKDY